MSAALATAEPRLSPGPSQDRPVAAHASAAAPAPGNPAVPGNPAAPAIPSPPAAFARPNVATLLRIVRWIITFGTTLAGTLHTPARASKFLLLSKRCKTGVLAVLVARMRRALMLAAALEQKLAARAAKGREIPVMPGRLPSLAVRMPEGLTNPPAAKRTSFFDRPLDHVPTVQELAAELRRRPVGAVLVDLCHELGIELSDLTAEQNRELRHAIMLFGGSLVTLLFKDFNDSMRECGVLDRACGRTPKAAPPAHPLDGTALCTGPP